MKKIATMIMALGVMALVSCGGGGGNAPSNTVKNYLDALKSGKYEKAISYFDMDKLEADQMKALTGKMDESLKAKGGVKSFKLVDGGEKISECGNKATVEAVMTYGNGETEEQKLKLKNVNDEWKIDMSAK